MIETPVTVFDLRKTLAVLIGGNLGVFENGQPAIWVEPPDPPRNGNGLHCFIFWRPRQLQLTTGYSQSIQRLAWQVSLVQTDRSLGAIDVLGVAGDLIRDNFMGVMEASSQSYADKLPSLEFSIPFTKIVNTVIPETLI